MEKYLDGLDLEKDYLETFKDHALEVTDLGPIKIYDFGKRDSSNYYCRLVLDGPRAYFTGDIGDFIWNWYGSQPITLERMAGFNMYYFSKKMICGTDIEDRWSPELAEQEFKENLDDYDSPELVERILEEMEGCYDDEMEYVVALRNSSIDDLDSDYWEWAYNIGKYKPTRFYLWLLAIRLMQHKIDNGEYQDK